jgi:hypothetical protein
MKPLVQPLAFWQRKLIFILLLLAFLFSLPVFMFYATGYRYDFFSDSPSITATGGLYLSAEALEIGIFVDEVEITNARIFRNASYIQGLTPGLHRVHVQSPGRHTWVKNLSVYPHIVTEAESFNLPLVPQVRPITEYQTSRGEAVFFVATTTAVVLDGASSTVPLVLSTSTATSTLRVNQEFVLVKDLFAAQASTTAQLKKIEQSFSFATSTVDISTEVATTTVIRNNLALVQEGEDVVAYALGTGRQIPHYFCTTQVELEGGLKSEAAGDLAPDEILFEDTLVELSNNTRECRTKIIIDRKWQKVIDFNFLPKSENLVLMGLEDGVYVVEIDDRSWQNAQLLYAGTDLRMLVYSGGIFIKDGTTYLEVYTDIEPE